MLKCLPHSEIQGHTGQPCVGEKCSILKSFQKSKSLSVVLPVISLVRCHVHVCLQTSYVCMVVCFQAFSHFTFERSGHELIVVDIQGVGDLWTDPQIHTSDGDG